MDDAQTRTAYVAMLRFLELQQQQHPGETMAELLERMALLEDGEPVDPALWQDWLESVQLTVDPGSLDEPDPL